MPDQVTYIPVNQDEPIRVEERLTKFTFEESEKYVGGDPELVHVHQPDGVRRQLMVNEVGHRIGLPLNVRATQYYPFGAGIVGPAILLEGRARMR